MNIPDKRLAYYVIYNVALGDGMCVAISTGKEVSRTCHFFVI
jgi:hypothetical protein